MTIRVEGAYENNLQGVDAEFAPGLTVVTGISGSGKTSLVYDTVYYEAKRRFDDVYASGMTGLASAPAKARRFTGLGPVMAVGQDQLNRNPRSTLATASGLHPLLRLLYARFGRQRCRSCQTEVAVLSADEFIERLYLSSRSGPAGVFLLLVKNALGSHRFLRSALRQETATVELFIDGIPDVGQDLDPTRPHDLELKLPDLTVKQSRSELRAIVELTKAYGGQALKILSHDSTRYLTRAPLCPLCGTGFETVEPVHFHTECPSCHGARCPACAMTGIHPLAASVYWQDFRITDLLAMSVAESLTFLTAWSQPAAATRLKTELIRRLISLHEVGLGYVALDRSSPTLSRGESQRVRLAVALTNRMEDVIHILDEPSIGLHPYNLSALLTTLRLLPGPVIYIEHDRNAAAIAERVLDLGPGAGSEGGRLLFSGTPAELWQQDSLTGRYFSLRRRVAVPERRPYPERFFSVRGANLRNLKAIDVTFPYNRLAVVTGVSGSGKSTLIIDVLAASLVSGKPVGCRSLDNSKLRPIIVEQSPIGINSRSNPGTYTKLADIIRDFFAAKTGLTSSCFSFNRPEGFCSECNGLGAIEVKMKYLPSTWLKCRACDGQRFADEVREARIAWREHSYSIVEIYAMSIREVRDLFIGEQFLPPPYRRKAQPILDALCDVGLGYLSLGQPSPSVSGGEAQRIKLASYLGRHRLHDNLLILDEPTTGLHPYDVAGLCVILDRLVRQGATIIVVEHNQDFIGAADWIIDLGPGAGPEGGHLVYCGSPQGLLQTPDSVTAQSLLTENQNPPAPKPAPAQPVTSKKIKIVNAYVHNLKHVTVEIPKGAFTVVTGVSGSGKSSLVHNILEAEARRRYLETLAMYERQGTREGPEALCDAVSGLGMAVSVSEPKRSLSQRATVGMTTELVHHLAILFALAGEYNCPACQTRMARDTVWQCPACGETAAIAQPRHFIASNYGAACRTCQGVGTIQVPNPRKLLINPELPLCCGAMYSPGFFPKGYLCKPYNGGYDMVQALARRYGFEPAKTPWNQMSEAAQKAFLFGDQEPLEVLFRSKNGKVSVRTVTFSGFYGFIRDWDVGGTYTDSAPCPECHGAKLRAEYLRVTLLGQSIHALSLQPLGRLSSVITELEQPIQGASTSELSLGVLKRRLEFLKRVGLGYLTLDRLTSTLSAGEAQRVKLAGLLGSGLSSLTIMLDEPTRGLHPVEVASLIDALLCLRNDGNTVIAVEHDLSVIRAADHLIDLGPGAGAKGGEIVAEGKPSELAKAATRLTRWLKGEAIPGGRTSLRKPSTWLTISGARENNLKAIAVAIPLGALTGICGVSGSGKSTLLIDTLGRVLAPKKQTTSVAYELITPGKHDAIVGAPPRTILVDQVRAGIVSPASFLGIDAHLRKLYANSETAILLGYDEPTFTPKCTACKGSGTILQEMGFLPSVRSDCDCCQGTGFGREIWDVKLRGYSLPELLKLTLEEVGAIWSDHDALKRIIEAAYGLGLGYLVLRQPGYSLSGGEAQRLKIVHELCRKTTVETLFLLDEPTVGQHLDDVQRLVTMLDSIVSNGHSVVVIEHHPHFLAACDWLIELGPGGGPEGGFVIASGPPKTIATGTTPIAPFLREILELQ